MKKWGNRCLRPTAMLAMAVLILTLPACGGGGGGSGGGGVGTVTGTFASNDAGTMTDLVRFDTASSCTGNMCTLDIRIGQTTETDYYAFAFDVVISDTTVAKFINGSDVAGDFLTGSVDSVAAPAGDRVVVGVSKSGAVVGNGTATEKSVVTLTFQLLKVGSATLTFVGSPSNPNLANCSPTGPEAINDAGDCTVATTFGAGGVLSGS